MSIFSPAFHYPILRQRIFPAVLVHDSLLLPGFFLFVPNASPMSKLTPVLLANRIPQAYNPVRLLKNQ